MFKENEKRPERLVADDVSEVIWLRLRRLTSIQLCRKIIQKRNPQLNSEIIDRKADGMAWSVKSALGYWDTKSGGLNSKVLSRYYALLQLSIAEQIASSNPKDDLPTIQRHTENGHGLFTVQKPDTDFPMDFLIGCLRSGHFASYCKNLGLDIQPFSFEKRPRKYADISKDEISKVISLGDLLRRIPEMQPVISEYLGLGPLSFQIGYAQRNIAIQAEKRAEHIRKTGSFSAKLPSSDQETITTFVAIYPHGENISEVELNGFELPIKNIVKNENDGDNEDHFIGELQHSPTHTWWNFIETYKSGYCGTSVIVPFLGATDPLLLHLIILYAFSIIVRYLPERWHEIEDGRLDHIRALIEHYLVVVDNVLPKLVVERLTGTRMVASQSGSWNAPI